MRRQDEILITQLKETQPFISTYHEMGVAEMNWRHACGCGSRWHLDLGTKGDSGLRRGGQPSDCETQQARR